MYGFELRDPSWHTEGVYDVLRRYNAAFCIYELAGFQSPTETTADFVYVRSHGPLGTAYRGSYPKSRLALWARRIRRRRKTAHQVYVYFDNDQASFAPRNALELKILVE